MTADSRDVCPLLTIAAADPHESSPDRGEIAHCKVDAVDASGEPRLMMMHSPIRVRCSCLVLVGLWLAGCSSSQQPEIRVHPERVDAATVAERDPRHLAIFDGRTGESLNWEQLIARMDGADVIILGEQHDDGVAHATQLAIVQDVAARRAASGAGAGALSLEMLERDDQAVTDDYLEGIVDAETFAKLTSSADWAGPGTWKKWYQPTIDAAASAGWRIVAANSPRRYLRIARTDGYARLESLPASRRALFDIPKTWPLDYRQRFIDVMAGMDDDEEEESAAPAATAPASQPASQPSTRSSPHGPMKSEDIDPGLRSQLLWDATMADSIAKARRGGARPVIHLVGQFHSDFNGGTAQETRARLGKNARIITVSMQRRERDPPSLHERDRNRADFVIYTGRPPTPSASTPASANSDSEPR